VPAAPGRRLPISRKRVIRIEERQMILARIPWIRQIANVVILETPTPSSAVNFLRSSSASAPGAPSGITKTSYIYHMSGAMPPTLTLDEPEQRS
jgi:hypothetical protein